MMDSNRADRFERLRGSEPDILIIGGGIVGAGVARDAAMRGLKVALADQHDFAFGTSSRSSRLLHGGLRYLAQGRLGLVREASIEKRIIHRIAPHLAEPLEFIFPTYSNKPAWPKWKLRAGVKMYDLLCGGQNFGNSGGLSAPGTKQLLRGINERHLTGAVRYFDGLTNDARLVIDTLRSAESHGAVLVNYCRVTNIARGAKSWACGLTNLDLDEVFEVHPRCIVNAAGPWGDLFEHSAVNLRLTKGIHLVIDRARLNLPGAVVLTEGTRILFVIPWGERVILGTTDTDYEADPADVSANSEDIAYVLGVVNEAFPDAKIDSGDIISMWAGLRPLIADSKGRPSDISRSHEINSPAPGWWDIAGGKLTTYRLMAEQAVDRIEKFLHGRKTPCRTAVDPLLLGNDSESFSRIVPPPFEREPIEHYCRNEWALHVEDIMVRRGGWHHYERNRAELAGRTSEWMREALGWSEERRGEELKLYLAGCDRNNISRE